LPFRVVSKYLQCVI